MIAMKIVSHWRIPRIKARSDESSPLLGAVSTCEAMLMLSNKRPRCINNSAR